QATSASSGAAGRGRRSPVHPAHAGLIHRMDADADAAQNEVNGHLSVQACRVERGDLDISLTDDQREFCASQNDSLSAVLPEVLDLIKDIPLGLGFKDTHTEFSLDHPMQLIAYRLRRRHQDLDTVMLL